MSELELAKTAMEEAFPRRAITTSRTKRAGARAHLELPGASSVRYAYLNVGTEPDPSLRLFPADTLSQARVLYRNPDRARRLMNLEARGWRLTPNFHFGFINKGLVWTSSKLPPRDYIEYWIEHIPETRILQRAEWDTQLTEWIREGVFDEATLPLFRKNFHETKRAQASPRPGLRALKPIDHKLNEPIVRDELRKRLAEILEVLQEPGPLDLSR